MKFVPKISNNFFWNFYVINFESKNNFFLDTFIKILITQKNWEHRIPIKSIFIAEERSKKIESETHRVREGKGRYR